MNEAAAERYDNDVVDTDADLKGVKRIAADLEETLLHLARPEDAIINYRIDDTSSSELETNWDTSSTIIRIPINEKQPSAAAK